MNLMSITVILLILVVCLIRKTRQQTLAIIKLQQRLDTPKNSAIFDSLFQSLLSQTSDAVAVVDQNLTIIIANSKTQEAFEAIFGQQYIPGKNISNLLANLPIQQAIAKQLWSRALNGESFCLTEAFQDRLNQQRHYEMTFTPIRNNGGEVIQALMLAKDITQQVKSQAKLQKLNQQLEAMVDTRTAQLLQINQQLTQEIEQRQQIELELRESEQRLRKAIINAPFPVFIHGEDGEIIHMSHSCNEITGYTESEINTIEKWSEKAYRDHHQQAKARINQLYHLEHKVDEGEVEIITATGETRVLDFSTAPLGQLPDGRRVVISMAKDITQTKQAEVLLRESEERFRATFEQAAVGIAHVGATSDNLGQWLQVNQKLCEIVGYSPEELLQKTFQQITYPADLETDLQLIHQLLAGEINTYILEKRYIRKDSSIVWINLTVSLVKESDTQPKYFIAVIEDISERKQLEETVGQSLKRLENLHQLDKAILSDLEPETVARAAIKSLWQLIPCQRVTIAMVDLASKTGEILVTKGHESVNIQTNFSLQLMQPLIQRLQQEQSYFIADLSLCSEDSEQIQKYTAEQLTHFLCVPLRTGQQLLGFLKLWTAAPKSLSTEQFEIINEVSDQVAIALKQTHLYRTVRQYATELEQRVAERTAEIQEVNQELVAFTYSVSHDLRAPLRSIQGFATALLEDYSDRLDEVGIDYAQRLVSSAQQLDHLIQDLLTYSRLTQIEIRHYPIHLSEVIDRVLEQLHEQIEQKQAQITIVEPLDQVIGNQTILLQVISNLLTNALKFVAPEDQPSVRIRTEKRGVNVRLWIEDNGIGIESEYYERIFRVFERLHGGETYPGTGIGLAIVRRGIRRLGGRCGVESHPNSGSRFWIELPCTSAPPRVHSTITQE
ncbi:MAG: PAS domain S-box protein [Microcoleaceae cyanobacterium]